MFTGIVEAAVPVAAVLATDHSLSLTLDLGPCAEGVRPGDSISVRGCCLTVERIEAFQVFSPGMPAFPLRAIWARVP